MTQSLVVLAWLATVAPAAAAERAAARTPDGNGKALYNQACASCHMPDGSGVPGQQPALDSGNRFVVGEPARLIRLLLDGAAALPGERERYSNEMPTFENLSDDEIAAVLTYVRIAFGNKARAITAAQVAAERAQR